MHAMPRNPCRRLVVMGLVTITVTTTTPNGFRALAADLTAREVTQLLFAPDKPDATRLSERDLSYLDLSGLDFKAASLRGANLHGTILSDSRLTGTDLRGANLNLTTLTRTDFTNANLEGASLVGIAFTASTEARPRETPKFAGANLRSARLHARFDYTDFSGADLSNAVFGPEYPLDDRMWGARPVFSGADFSRATLRGARVRNTLMRFARFNDADLQGADFSRSDLSKADLTGADVSGADFTRTKLYGALLTGVRGLDSAKGLDHAIDFAETIR